MFEDILMESVFGFEFTKNWEYENGFYLTSHITRISKLISHYELYKSIIELPGHVLEFGVYKGASLIRMLTFREMLESQYSRKIVGFDAFGKFPSVKDQDDQKFIKRFEDAGGDGISKNDLEVALGKKGFTNYELIEGDIHETLPNYLREHPELRISLLHIDVDVYEPTETILSSLLNHVVRGGVIMLDDYNTVSGETKAVDDYFSKTDVIIKKLPISHIPSFIRIK
ncbi:MAG: Demethyldecarbamoylnovobiocin O-methyltransferase [Candidatus Heimdallarchaeota archaeon LC_2]|nr:MAG: Demethyldecarbamoylnovobiocin O-methyltransferase [Candidatus Heimdallarchaeota archaeon LC_2]